MNCRGQEGVPRDLHQQGKWRQKLGNWNSFSVASSILQYIQKNMKKTLCFQKESDLQMILPPGNLT